MDEPEAVEVNVILDTNIYFEHFYLDGLKFVSLFEYLKKTNSKLLMPEIVRSEILKSYSRTLRRYLKDANRYENVLFKKQTENNDEKINSLEKEYEIMLNEIIKKEKIEIISSKKFSLEKVIERSLNETPPFKTEGRGFKDTLIWLSVLDELRNGDKDICFITNNTNDFGKDGLDAKLIEEVKNYSNKIYYYQELEKFLSTNFRPIKEFVDRETIDKFIKRNEFINFIERNLDNRLLGESYDVGEIDEVLLEGLDLYDVRVINENDKEVYIELKLTANLMLVTSETIHDDGEEIRINENSHYPDVIVSIVVIKNKTTEKIKVDENSYEFKGFFARRPSPRKKYSGGITPDMLSLF